MPLLDVSDLLSDPDFVTLGMICNRSAQTVGANGMAVNTPSKIQFSGVVTSDKGDVLERLAAGERIVGNIMITTTFRLRDGKSGYTADIVTVCGINYTVASVNDYSRYGRGFVEASCDLIPLSG